MIKASNLKKGNVVRLGNQLAVVKHIDVKTPSARGALTLYKIRFSQVPSGQKIEQTFKGNDMVEDVELTRKPVQFLFREGNHYTFMDTEEYSQYTLEEESLENQTAWIGEDVQGLTALFYDGNILAIELPQVITLEIADTSPVIRGATVTGRTKTATLTNGVDIQVPEYMSPGELVKVQVETAKFISRAQE
jgi:elongation factor P